MLNPFSFVFLIIILRKWGVIIGRKPNRVFTCAQCGLQYPSELKIVVSQKNYCPSCGTIRRQRAEDYKNLFNYIFFTMGYDGVLDPKKMSVPVSILKKGYHMDASKVLWTLKYINEYEKNKPRRMQTEMDLIKLVTSYYLQAKFFWASCEELDQSSTQEKIDESLDHPIHQIVINRSDLEKARIADEEKRAIREHRVIPEDYEGDIDGLDFNMLIWDADYDQKVLQHRKELWEAEKAKEEDEFYFTDEILPEDLNEEDLLLYEGETDSWQIR